MQSVLRSLSQASAISKTPPDRTIEGGDVPNAGGISVATTQVWVRRSLLVLLAALGLYGVLFIYHAAHLAFARGELNYGESTWLFAAIRMRHGLSPYFDYSQPPYIPMAYPPVEPGLAGLLGALFDASDDQVVAVSRLLTLAATLAIVGAIFVACRSLGSGRLPSLVAALLFLTPYHTYALWSYVARGDMLAVAFGVWAIVVVLLRPRGWGLIAGGALAGLALATKQTAIAPVLACTWWLVDRGRVAVDGESEGVEGAAGGWRGATLLWGGFAGALALTLMPLGTEAVRLLVRHTADLVSQPWTVGPLYARVRDLVGLVGLVAPVALVGAVARVAAPVALRGLVLRYGVVALAVLLVSSGKVGSASSYCLELIAIFCMLAGPGIQWLFEAGRVRRGVIVGASILVPALLAIQTANAPNVAQSFSASGADDRPLLALAGPNHGPVLSEDGYILLHGTDPPVLIDPFFFSALASVGRWDPGPLRRMASERKFRAIVLTRPIETPLFVQGVPWLPEGVGQAIAQNYIFKATQGRYYVYVPRP